MRLAISNPRRAWGGASTMALELARGLSARGHHVVLICRPQSPLLSAAGGLPVEAVLSGADFPGPAIVRCMRALRRHDVNVLLSATEKDMRLSVPAARLSGVPAVVRRVSAQPLPGGIKQWFDRLPDHWIANSDATRAALLASAPWLSSRRVSVILNGIDVARFTDAAPADLQLPAGAIAVGYVGRLDEEKGIAELAAAWPTVARAVPDAHLVVAGIGALGALFEPLAERRTRLLGFRTDVPSLMKALDLLIVPSRTEAFGLVAAEALAASVPVVATDVGGLTEVVGAGEFGRMVPSRDPEALAHAVIALSRDAALRRRLGAAGRAHVAERFSWTATLDAYESLLEACAADNGKAPTAASSSTANCKR